MRPIDTSLLAEIAPPSHGATRERQQAIIAAVGPVLGQTLAADDIAGPLRIAHFLAQVGHESAGFRTTEEFASGLAYEGRRDLGNTEPGDGPRFRGRGLLQLTGRANYRRFGRMLGLDLEARPEIAAEPVVSLRIACAYWTDRRINRPADRDDIVVVTRLVNGGTNGIADRRAWLARAKAALGLPAPAAPLLAEGARGPAVSALQARLVRAGAALGVDGVFGAATARAVREWQALNGLDPDGIVGPRTRAALAL